MPQLRLVFYADRQSESTTCPNCQFEMSASLSIAATAITGYDTTGLLGCGERGTCPKCQITIPWADLSNRVIHGGNRILVNKFWLKFKNPQRWDVTVFVYPLYDLRAKAVLHRCLILNGTTDCAARGVARQDFQRKRRITSNDLSACPAKNSRSLTAIFISTTRYKENPTLYRKRCGCLSTTAVIQQKKRLFQHG